MCRVYRPLEAAAKTIKTNQGRAVHQQNNKQQQQQTNKTAEAANTQHPCQRAAMQPQERALLCALMTMMVILPALRLCDARLRATLFLLSSRVVCADPVLAAFCSCHVTMLWWLTGSACVFVPRAVLMALSMPTPPGVVLAAAVWITPWFSSSGFVPALVALVSLVHLVKSVRFRERYLAVRPRRSVRFASLASGIRVGWTRGHS